MRVHTQTHDQQTTQRTTPRDILTGRETANRPSLRIVQLGIHAAVTVTALALFLNAVFIGGVPALVAGAIIGQSVEALLLAVGVSGIGATVAQWTTAVGIWAVCTIPGLYILDG